MVNEPKTIEIQHQAHVALARRIVATFAREQGFDRTAVEEIAIAVTELATNLVKHDAKNGRISSSLIENNGRKGIEIISMDSGPGIRDGNLAMEDEYSTRGTMGGGLGAVNRLMDEFHATSKTADLPDVMSLEVGTRISCRKWLPKNTVSTASPRNGMNFSVMARPMPGELCSGDGYFLKRYEDIHFIALVDGLGHGEKAHIAAETALGFIRDNYKKSLEQIFQGVHRVSRKTRGVVMSICRIDLEKKTLTYAGIGNVTTRVFDSLKPINPPNFGGTLGVVLRTVREFEYPWRGGVIVMYSDGIKNRWSLNDFPELKRKAPVEIAGTLLKRFGRDTDDATIIVGKST